MTYRTFDGTAQTESVTLGRYSASTSGVSDGSTTQGAVYFSDDVDTGFYSPANNKIALITGGTERLHIDDSGNVGIGTAPGTQFEINGATPYFTLKNDTHEDTDGGRESKIIFEGEQSGGEIATLAQIQASHDGSSDDEKGDLIFSINDGSDGTSPTERVRISSDGDVTVTDGDLVVGTAGHGIDFAATSGSGTSELFDDYEEGSWTPGASFGTGTTGIAYTTQSGAYTKIGRQVTVNFNIDLSNKGSDTGDFRVENLPFAAADLISGTTIEANGIAAYWNNIATDATTLTYWAAGSDLKMGITTAAADNPATADEGDFNNNTSIRGTITYFAAT